MGRTFIVIRTSFEAGHHWPDCPFNDVAFLRNQHRHIFYVELKKEVFEDRGIEFIRFKRVVEEFIKIKYAGKDLGPTSCEVMAKVLADKFNANSVEISEDLENSAIYEA
ncbi:hypothetical protein KKH23_10070 [Patescibacteria group bacterium]|uniref:Uncharacterized protein n=1 Tax=viral metagenome TaxID=1070528 RepID=A0A6M3LY91_9ZZZZ|nr:hypothetical protein [Patescibacteria group bacterium]MBU0847518.1 hypothetical protein [Patescibacteria group bacterium]